MKGRHLGPDDWRAVYDALKVIPSFTTAARQLHLSRTAVKRAYRNAIGELNLPPLDLTPSGRHCEAHLRAEARAGKRGYDPVLPGYEISSTSTRFGRDGEVIGRTVVQRQEHGEVFATPEGHRIKGISAFVGADGREIAKWVKTSAQPAASDQVAAALKTVFAEYKGRAEPVPPPEASDADLMTVYNIADHHLGMFAWARETGADYDLKIAARLLRDTMARLVAAAPCARTAVVLNLGDFVHADNSANRTERSGNALDVDTRYAKVLAAGVRLLVQCIELALGKHERVIVRCLPGNHDPHTALALTIALVSFFHDHPRVIVDDDPGKFWMLQHGKVMVAATHGDMVKPDVFPGVMASMWPKVWGETSHRYAYFGHVHHRSRGGGENAGVVWETFQTLAGKDAWHFGEGYVSGRSMVAITHHAEHGEFLRNTASVPSIEPA